MRIFIGAWLLLLPALSLQAGWNPRLAADYLDSRQQAWSAWPVAKATGGTCFSCHTGATYLLARPSLRRVLGETTPLPYETSLLDGLRVRAPLTTAREMRPSFAAEPLASQSLGVEAVFAVLFLDPDSDPARQALARFWKLQIKEGPAKGAWPWFSLSLDPYEMPASQYYGAALAAMAIGNLPAAYRHQPGVREPILDLQAYLSRERDSQPLHNRLMLLWASAKLPDLLTDAARQAILAEIWRKQEPDGGWTTQSLGPWEKHAGAPAGTGSDSYATALTACVIEAAGAPDVRLTHALSWLESHQDRQTGSWPAQSMNTQYPSGSMPAGFMRDAATAFAALALSAPPKAEN